MRHLAGVRFSAIIFKTWHWPNSRIKINNSYLQDWKELSKSFKQRNQNEPNKTNLSWRLGDLFKYKKEQTNKSHFGTVNSLSIFFSLGKVHLIWQAEGGMKILKLKAWNFSSPPRYRFKFLGPPLLLVLKYTNFRSPLPPNFFRNPSPLSGV